MKKKALHSNRFALCVLLLTMILSALVTAGELNPPAPPTSGTMKPLSDVEPRTAIHQSDIPLTIAQPGSYYLAENLSWTGTTCIQVSASDVTVDLCGFTMDGGGSGDSGIYLSGTKNVEIRNGTIRNCMYGIIVQASSGCEDIRIFDLRMMYCSDDGIFLRYCANCQVKGCTIANGVDMYFGVCVGDNSVVSGNTIYNNNNSLSSSRFIGIESGNCCTVSGNTVCSNGASTSADSVTGIWTGYGCTIASNTVRDNGHGAAAASVYGIYAGTASVVKDNASYNNGDAANTVRGISCGSGSTAANNASYENGTNALSTVYGIYLSSGASATNNTASKNGVSGNGTVYGIYNSTGCTVTGNTAYDNGDSGQDDVSGIRCLEGCTVTGNSAYSNGSSATGTYVYGIYASTACSVVGNTARSNGVGAATANVYGIYLAGYDLVNNNTASGNEDTDMNMSATSVYGVNLPNIVP